jgi:signal recognition particle receptor subunit alpha
LLVRGCVTAGVGQFVRRAFEDSLSGILNKRQVDVLHDIKRARARGKPYVVVFCGVNGVGKSTNLAKIAYWLGQHGCKVQLAACDTFRAGAVEQLKTHAMRLGVSAVGCDCISLSSRQSC